jgi:hypothetical protein
MAVTNKRGIFSLTDVRERQSVGVWSVRSDVWSTPSAFRLAHPYGYWVGGYQSTDTSRIDRVDFTNDEATALTRTNLSLPKRAVATIASADYGYAAGGIQSLYYSTVERLALANDTVTPLIRGPVNNPNNAMAGSGNKNYGWIVGGNEGSGPISRVDRIDYSNDTATASARTNLPDEMAAQGATGTQDYGYHGSGVTVGVSYITTLYRIDYANDTTITTKGPLLTARWGSAATGNASYGWWGAGYNGSNTSNTDRIDYASDTATATPKGNVHSTRVLGASGNQNFGYWGGGGAPAVATVTRLQYANDTSNAVTKGSLTQAKYNISAFGALENNFSVGTILPALSDQRPNVVSQGIDTGYVSTGSNPAFTGAATSKAERIDYSNDTATATGAGNATPGGLISTAGTGNANFGYTTGGFKLPSGRSYVTRLDYFNDTAVQSPKGPLSAARYDHAATGNADFGYIIAGKNPSGTRLTSVDRIDYSNDNPNASPKGPIDISRDKTTATGNADFGYVAGGGFPLKSTIERIIYANDTATAVIRSNLPSNSNGRGAAGTKDYGYWGGGAGPGVLSRVDRLDYSNDTTNAVTKGPLSAARYSNFGNSSTTHGYFGSGTDPAYLTSIDRIDFSSDTTTASPKGNLIDARRFMASFSSRSNAIPPTLPGILEVAVRLSDGTYGVSNMGYFGGGENPVTSSIQRIDFANDTETAVVKSSLASGSTNAAQMSTFGNTTKGYWAGSKQLTSSSYVNRLDYYNDTATTSIRGYLPDSNAGGAAGFGNNNYGYVFNGWGSSMVTTVRRVDFSNDTATGSTRGPTTATRYSCQGVSNQSYGYITGSWPSGAVERIDFSNDTAATTPVGSLTMPRLRFGDAIGNSNYGWVGGGDAPGNSSKIDRIDYSNDTATASTRGPLTYTTRYQGATGNADYGYFAGGQWYATVNRIDYSNDTVTASPKGSLSTSNGNMKGISAKESGYSASAAGPAVVANLPVQIFPSTVLGYFGGGLYTSPSDSPTASLDSIDRINFANDTTTTLSSTLNYSPARRNNMGSVASSTHGYWVSGAYGNGSSSTRTTDSTRMEFSNDTGTLVVRGNLPKAIYGLRGVGNSNFGYFIGGDDGTGIYYGQQTTINRIDYSNDSVFTTVGSLDATIGRTSGAAVGNQNYGYYAGGYGIAPNTLPSTRSWSDIFRIDYSNDTSNAPVRAKLDGERYSMAATGNANFGYFSGGYLLAPPTYYSSIVKYDYANDTTNASSTANLTGGNRFNHMGTGSQNFGYFAGGGSYISSVEKFDYSNDTVDASPKGPLSGGNRGSGGACSAAANGLPQ